MAAATPPVAVSSTQPAAAAVVPQAVRHPALAKLRSAAEIRYAMDNAHQFLKPIGECRTLQWAWEGKQSHRDSDDDASDDDDGPPHKYDPKYKRFRLWRNIAEEQHDCINCAHGQLLPGELSSATISITPINGRGAGSANTGNTDGGSGANGTTNSTSTINEWTNVSLSSLGKVDSIEYKQLLLLSNVGTSAVYGDVATLTTRQDPKVRKGKDLAFVPRAGDIIRAIPSVNDHLCRTLEQQWFTSGLLPSRVRIVPYKINFYGAGDHFAVHTDTPEMGMVGTMLLGLHDSSNADAGTVIHAGKTGGRHVPKYRKSRRNDGAANGDDSSHKWRADLGAWCAFFTNVPHEVLPVSDGQRITLSFKVYSVDDVPADAYTAPRANSNDSGDGDDGKVDGKSESPHPAVTIVRADGGDDDGKPKAKNARQLKREARAAKQRDQEGFMRTQLVAAIYDLADWSKSLSSNRAAFTFDREHGDDADYLTQLAQQRARDDALAEQRLQDAVDAKLKQIEQEGNPNYSVTRTRDTGDDDKKSSKNRAKLLKEMRAEAAAVLASDRQLQFGLVLKNFYSLFPGEMKGGDAKLLTWLRSVLQPSDGGIQWATNIEVVPVRIKFHGERDSFTDSESWSPSCNTSVYALGQPELGHILSSSPYKEKPRWSFMPVDDKPELPIPFYSVNKEQIGERWSHSHEAADDGANGNCSPETEDSLYVACALIITLRPLRHVIGEFFPPAILSPLVDIISTYLPSAETWFAHEFDAPKPAARGSKKK